MAGKKTYLPCVPVIWIYLHRSFLLQVKSNSNSDLVIYTKLLHVLVQELPMEVIPNCIIDEAFGWLELSTCLVLENNIIIPPAAIRKSFLRYRPDSPHLLHELSDLNRHLINKVMNKDVDRHKHVKVRKQTFAICIPFVRATSIAGSY